MNGESLPVLLREALRMYGPGGEPPEWVSTALLRRLQNHRQRLLPAVLAGGLGGLGELEGLVIAYGVGSGRVIHPGAGGWHAVWDKSRQWLEVNVSTCTNSTSRYLEFGLRIEGYAFRQHEELRHEVVQMLVEWLIEGTCACSELLPDKSQHRQARCRIAHCVKGWDPERCSFSNFIWQAVKGSMAQLQRNLGKYSPYGLVQGMHFYNLHEISHLRLGDVLVWVCETDGYHNFEGLPCRKCHDQNRGKVCDPFAFRTVMPRLIIPKAWDGRYLEQAYWNCQHCRKLPYPGHPFFPGCHYYPEFLATCPKCGRGRTQGAKRSHVYVLGPRQDRSLQEEIDRDSEARAHPIKDLAVAGLDGCIGDPHSASASGKVTGSILDKLEPIPREFMELRYFEGLTILEAALEMAFTTKAAEELEAAAIKKLKALKDIKEDDEDEDE